jgi:hypothetical protein
MRIICAWCKKVISDPGNTTEESHGCCPDCVNTLQLEVEKLQKERIKERIIAIAIILSFQGGSHDLSFYRYFYGS